MGATNRIDILDNALVRPGRFDRKVTVSLPDYNGRKAIAGVHFNNKKLHENFDYNEVASLTSGFSGADLANLANEAAILSVRQNKTRIDKDILFDAYEKVTLGLKSYNQDPNEKVTELITYHETGHGILVKIFSEFFDLRKITINSNKSGAGGYTLFTPKEFFSKYPSKKFCLAQLVICLGGRAAEVYLSRKNYDPENIMMLTDETEKVFNKKVFNSMKKNSIFINVGRGGTVNEKDLLNALRKKKIFGAGLDVVEKEPIKSNSPFLSMNNVMVTPHIAGVTNKYWDDQILLFSENLMRYKRNQKLKNLKTYSSIKKGY